MNIILIGNNGTQIGLVGALTSLAKVARFEYVKNMFAIFKKNISPFINLMVVPSRSLSEESRKRYSKYIIVRNLLNTPTRYFFCAKVSTLIKCIYISMSKCLQLLC